jgi:hypothetical protein
MPLLKATDILLFICVYLCSSVAAYSLDCELDICDGPVCKSDPCQCYHSRF